MKNEWEEQLKAKWEAAKTEDFNLDFDTEALWNKIEKPQAKPKAKWMLPLFKYAAAIAVGAVLSWSLLDSKSTTIVSKTEYQIQPTTERVETEKPPETITKNSPVIADHTAIKQKTKTTATGSKNKKPKITVDEIPIAVSHTENVHPMTETPKTEIIVAQKKKLKTMHISDLEKAAPKVQEVNNFFARRTAESIDNVAFSTKIINKQF